MFLKERRENEIKIHTFSCVLIPFNLVGDFLLLTIEKNIFNIYVTILKIFHFVIMRKE